MSKIKAIVIDDELIPRKWLSVTLKSKFDEIEVLDTFDSVESGIEGIQSLQPDLVFLDIEMKDGNAFNLLDQLDQIDFKIIFTTAHQQYAINAIKMSALDYLIKPILLDELTSAINRYKNLPSAEPSIRLLSENIKNRYSQENKIILPTQEGYEFTKVSNIVYCKADINYTVMEMVDGKNRVISKTLKDYEEILGDHSFFRIHQSYLINLNHIQKYIRTKQAQVEMVNGHVLNVSRSKKEDFLKVLRSED